MDVTRRFLGISGSIRKEASSSLLLARIGEQLRKRGEYVQFSELDIIPPFNGEEKLPNEVQEFMNLIMWADFVIFCSPEYAHGVPGSLKNALDWTVATEVWMGKPVSVITAASQGEYAHASLIEILTTMSAVVNKKSSLLIPFIKAKINTQGEITDSATSSAVKRVVANMTT